MNSYDQANPFRSGPAWSRPEFLFTGTAVMLLAGVLIPWPDRLLDIFWICHFSLTAAVLVICAVARSSSQLEGFPALLASTSFLSFLATAGCMRAIVLRQDTCGRLIRAFGEKIAALEPLLALILILVTGFFILYLVVQSGRRIRQGIEHYLFQILPFKKIGLETDQTLHILTAQHVDILREKIRKEARFYASMNGLRKLLTAQISVNLFLLLAAWGLAWAGEMLQASAEQILSPLESLAPVIAGTAIFSWVPAGAAAAACAGLLNKESLALPPSETPADQNSSRKITIISSASGRSEEIELINPDFISSPPANEKPIEKIAQFEPPQPMIPKEMMVQEIKRIKIQCKSSSQYYQSMEKLFTHKSFRSSLLLLIAESVEDLPVTVAVHPAVQLARKKQNVLLVDADLQRHAVAKVFTMDPYTLQKPSAVHRIDHLWLQSILEDSGKLPEEIQDPNAEFTYRMIYSPQGHWLWNHMDDRTKKNIRILFFSSKAPEEIRLVFSEIALSEPLFVIPPLSAAVTQT